MFSVRPEQQTLRRRVSVEILETSRSFRRKQVQAKEGRSKNTGVCILIDSIIREERVIDIRVRIIDIRLKGRKDIGGIRLCKRVETCVFLCQPTVVDRKARIELTIYDYIFPRVKHSIIVSIFGWQSRIRCSITIHIKQGIIIWPIKPVAVIVNVLNGNPVTIMWQDITRLHTFAYR